MGTNRWVRFATSDLLPLIRGRIIRPVELSAEGFDLVFTGFSNPRPVVENGRIIWREREPRFTFFDESNQLLSPRYRTILYRTNEAIAKEVADTYRLAVSRDPFSFVFPKNYYAKTVNLEKGTILG